MVFDSFIERIRRIKADIINNREADALRIGFDMAALIKFDAQTKGEGAIGRFVDYTVFTQKDRKAKGYQIGFVDFTRTGRFWASVAPVVTKSTIFSCTITIESREKRGQDIIKGAAAKRGNIVEPSRRIIEIGREANNQRVVNYLNQITV